MIELSFQLKLRRNRYRLLKNLRGSEATVLHTLAELINFRLMRFFKYFFSHELFLKVFLSVAVAIKRLLLSIQSDITAQ